MKLEINEMPSIQEMAADIEHTMRKILPTVVCIPQDWDNRIDCMIRLEDGTAVGEMLGLDDLTPKRIRQTAERLRRKLAGETVTLIGEVSTPVRIARN
jgi:low affinity Fe/Cu permease